MILFKNKGWLVIALVILLTVLVGCNGKKAEPTMDYAALASSAAALAEKLEAEEGSTKVTGLPDPEQDGSNLDFFNELEELDNQLLLPMAIKIPEVVPVNTKATVWVSDFNFSPGDKWKSSCSNNSLTLHHPDGIAVQLVVSKTKAKYSLATSQAELKSFYDSFVEKDNYTKSDIFIADKLSGAEISFTIKHNDRDMRIIAGILNKSSMVAIYTINYFEDGKPAGDLIDTLFSTFKVKNDEVSRK